MFKKFLQDSILMHVFFVALFLIMPSISFVRPPGEPFFSLTRIFVQDTTANFVLLCFFYFNYYILLPKYYFNKRYLTYGLLVLVFLSVAFALPKIVGMQFPDIVMNGQPGAPLHLPRFQHRQHGMADFIFDEFRRHLGLFFTAIFFSYLLRTKQHLALVKEQHLEAELNSLKAQINPHFLFNTLNSIYTLSVKKDDRASDAILQLSGLMRYIIKESKNDKIALQIELDYISNYIALQEARLSNTVQIHYETMGEPGALEIAPLMLITYIENAFKYGINPDRDNARVDVEIIISNTGLSMQVFNYKMPLVKNMESTGMGIVNTAQRLQLLYPNKHQLNIQENEESYSVSLTLELI